MVMTREESTALYQRVGDEFAAYLQSDEWKLAQARCTKDLVLHFRPVHGVKYVICPEGLVAVSQRTKVRSIVGREQLAEAIQTIFFVSAERCIDQPTDFVEYIKSHIA
jgi:hypothetical protein